MRLIKEQVSEVPFCFQNSANMLIFGNKIMESL